MTRHFLRAASVVLDTSEELATNGAAMRALPIGWVLPHDQAEQRRQLTITMSRATHADPAALVAACVIAACASWALENASPSPLLAAAAEEAREAAQAVTTEPRLADMLTMRSARAGWADVQAIPSVAGKYRP